MNIGIIGAGNMGEAIIKGVSSQKKHSVFIAENNAKRAALIMRRYKIKKLNLEQLSKTCKIIILCVKPQNIDEIIKRIKGLISSKHIIISIAAGVTTTHIQKSFTAKVSVIRVMPNMPGMIGKGVSAFCLGKYAKKDNVRIRKLSNEIFFGLGKVVFTTEDKMNAITAISGSGPGFIADIADGLIQAGCAVGLNFEESRFFVMHTMTGASEVLICDKKTTPAEFAKRVASKGGTTEAGLKVFAESKIKGIINKAIKAATKRAKELSKD